MVGRHNTRAAPVGRGRAFATVHSYEMSILVLPLAPRARPDNRAGSGEAAAPDEFDYVFSIDGRSVTQTGRAAVAALPRADRLAVVLADGDVSWHRVDVPKAPPAKLRAALAGAMEEALLDDEETLHFALGPQAAPGSKGWVAVTHRGRLAAVLNALEGAGREVGLVAPASRPRADSSGHFLARPGDAAPLLVLERHDGVACVGLEGTLARSLLPTAGETLRFTAAPAAAAAAERWLGAPVSVQGEAERALAAGRDDDVNLRQFDLAARHRGLRALRHAWWRLHSPQWRAVRVGIVALAAVQLVGLNAYAWQQQRALAHKRQAMDELLRSTFPGVRTVLDAPLQMQREVERARAQAGRTGGADLEALLGVAAAAWPDGAAPPASLRFEGGKLTLATPAWGEPQFRQFRERLQGNGYAAESTAGGVTVALRRGAA